MLILMQNMTKSQNLWDVDKVSPTQRNFLVLLGCDLCNVDRHIGWPSISKDRLINNR